MSTAPLTHTSLKPPDLKDLGIHHDLIKVKAQSAINNFHASLIPALHHQAYPPVSGYNLLSAEQQQGLREHQALSRTNLINLRQYLDDISSVEAFAEPLLQDALLKAFGIACDVRKNVITLTTLNTFTGEITSRATQTLLQAALHNFLPEQAETGGIPRGSHLWDYKSTRSSDPAPKLLEIDPVAFARLCRELDIGKRYQEHLAAIISPPHAQDKLAVASAFIDHERSMLLLQADVALMNKHIKPETHTTLMRFGAGDERSLFGTLPISCNYMKLDEVQFSSMVLFHGDPLEQEQRCIVYIPGDPISCLKEYDNLRAAHADLMIKLQDATYREFFIHLAPQSQKLALTKRFNNRFAKGGRDPLGMTQQPVSGNLFQHLYTRKVQQLMADARFLAVPTDDINRIALLDRLEHYLDVSLNVLNVAAFFVPGLGEVMAVVFAAQIMGDVYHGIEAWEQDDKDLAWAYTKGVLINLATAAAIGKLASEFARPLPVKPVPLIEELAVFTQEQGQTRLWKPDITPFEHDISLPPALKPDAKGLYYHMSRYYLKLEDKHYCVEKTGEQTYRLLHPTQPSAYGPELSHNNHGAWKHGAEEHAEWDKNTLFRRLHPTLSTVDSDTVEQMLHACGVDDAELLQVHVDQSPPPALLDDSITRLAIDQDLQRFIQRMQAGDRTADPQIQLQLLVEEDMWPPTKALRFIDTEGKTITEYGNNATKKLPIIQVLDSQLRRGEMLKVVLESLAPEEVTALVGLSTEQGEIGSSLTEKAEALHKRLTRRARQRTGKLFTSRYMSPPMPDSPAAQQLLKRFPTLPGPVVNELLVSATQAELEVLEKQIRVPVRIAQEATIYSQELRLTRAFEGLYLEYLNNADTQKLILHSLADMPGWSKDVRIEVRDGEFSGRLLDHVGAVDAPILKVLVKEGARYQTYDANNLNLHGLDDLYASVLHALPDVQRRALGFPHPAQGPALKAALEQRAPMSRSALRDVLQIPRGQDTSPMQLAKGRPVDSFPQPAAARCARSPFACFRSNPRRVRSLITELYPTHTAEAVEEFLGLEDLYSREGLQRLEALKTEFRTLVKDLENWKAKPPELAQVSRHHVRLVHPMDRQRVINKLIKCWQRRITRPRGSTEIPSGVTLDIDGIHFGALPELTADFSHVKQLQFSNFYLQPGINGFLRHFPGLTSLKLSSTHLLEIPSSIFDLDSLTHLHLGGNSITLTAEAAGTFSEMTQLRTLDLSNNPLGEVPVFSRMTQLQQLNLRNTRLMAWPTGVETLDDLTHLDLRENNLTALPESYFQLPRERLRSTYVHGNPLPTATLEAVMAYREQLGLRFEARVHAQGSAPHPADVWLDKTQPSSQRLGRLELWSALQAEPGNRDFFRVIHDLSESPDFRFAREQLTQRVWRVIAAAAEDTSLRHEFFGGAVEHQTCIDRVQTVFSRFGYKVLLHEIGLLQGVAKETELVKLIKGRTRLLQLDDIAQTQIDLQTSAYNTAREEARLSPGQIAELKPDPLEVQLIYQVDLGDRLELPWQPSHMKFRTLAKITPAQIEEAFNLIINQEKIPGYLPKKMLEEEPWMDYLTEHYGAEIEAEREPHLQRIKDIDQLQELQEQWAEKQAEGDSDALQTLTHDLKTLAKKLEVDEQKVLTKVPMLDEDYYALQLKARAELDEVMVKLTQTLLDKKQLSVNQDE